MVNRPQKKAISTETTPRKGVKAVDRRVLFTRSKKDKSTDLANLLLAINKAITKFGLPEHIRLVKLWYTPTRAISGQLKERTTAEMLNPAKNSILEAVKQIDASILSLNATEQWIPLRVHTVSLNRYLNSEGMKILKEEIETTTGFNLPIYPRWINRIKAQERYNREEIAYSTVVIKVRTRAIADKCIAKGLEFGGKKHTVEAFWEYKPENICPKCSEFGHNSYKVCVKQAKCYICAGQHEGREHKCSIEGYIAKTGQICIHIPKNTLIMRDHI